MTSDTDHAATESLLCAVCGASRRAEAWCPLCLERYDRVEAPAADLGSVRAPRAYSRTKSGPVSFGMFGRVGLSIIPVVVAFFAVRNVMRSRNDPTGAYYVVLAVPTLVIALGFLAVVWRRERVS